MLKNCVFKDSVNTRKWMVNAGIRAVKTMAQTAVAVMGTSTVLSAIDWRTLVTFFTFLLLGASGLCNVDQQNNWTSMIPIKAPLLSMQTSRTEGPRPATKD